MSPTPAETPEDRSPRADDGGGAGGAPATTDAAEAEGAAAVRAFRRAETLLEQRRPLEALKLLDPLLGEAQAAASVHLLAARAYLASAQFRRAEEGFLRVLELDPADHYARFALGRTLQRQSRLVEARAQLRMAAAMDPRPEYQEALGEVSATIALR